MSTPCPLNQAENFKHNTLSFSKESFQKLELIMYKQKFEKESYLYWEGDTADKLYYLVSGTVRLTKMTDDGKDLSLYYFQPGDLFGEMDRSKDQVCTFSAEALTECEVGVIQRQDLESLLWQNGDVAIEFISWMGHMQKFTQLKLRDLMFFGKNGALASTLIRMTNTFGEKDGDKIVIKKRFTNIEIASLIGSTRETVNRMLSQLKKDKAIDYKNGYVTILNLEYLKEICHCEGCPASICRL
jgi:CRP/FNR family transcriptional regulator, cyclic AMP receptor protein